MKIITKLTLLLFMVAFLQACNLLDDDDDVELPEAPELPAPNSITDIAAGASDFSILVAALQETGLDATLADLGSTFTVFAPTNAAFEALLADLNVTADELLARDDLADILTYHVLSGRVDAAAALAAAGTRVATVNGADIGVSTSGGALFVNQATVTDPDFALADNGLIHVIDAVILPPAMRGEPTSNIVETAVAAEFSILADLLVATGLDETLANAEGEFTVFAPTNEAFEALGPNILGSLGENTDVLTEILLQHVVVGATVDSITAYTLQGNDVETADGTLIPLALDAETDSLIFGGANVIMPDVYATNGVIHVIDSVVVGDVVVPPYTITDLVVATDDFSTLLAALVETGLDETLNNIEGTFTVFAPTNAAFAALLEALDVTAEELLAREDLADILTYHVVGSEIDAAAAIAAAGTTVTTVNGADIAVSLVGDELLINQATVTGADAATMVNGIVHIIDSVLLPPAMRGMPADNIVETALGNDDFSILTGLLVDTGLDQVLADANGEFTVFAPTNEAFLALGDAVLTSLAQNPDILASILLQHVVTDITVDSITAYTLQGMDVETAGMTNIPLTLDPMTDSLVFGGSTVIATDVFASNGVIHVIDAVIVGDVVVPDPLTIGELAATDDDFSILLAALQETGLDETLSDVDSTFTLFAPTNDAFEDLLVALGATAEQLLARDDLADILLYHVLAGEVNAEAAIAAAGTTVTTVNGADIGVSLSDGTLFVNQATVTEPDAVPATNGIIHVIDAVLLPPAAPGMPMDNIVETAVAAGFSTLAQLLVDTGLDATLADESAEFTVFAPTNEAFAALGDDILTSLVENPDVLEEILLQHVVVGAVDSVTAYSLNGTNVTTASMNEIPLMLNAMTDSLVFGGATVTTADVYTSNGIIHIIDTVVVGDVDVPKPGDNIVEVAIDNGNFTTLAAALVETGLDATLSNEDAEFTVFAPTDAAFAKLLAQLDVTADELLMRDDLADILLYHVIADATILADAALMTAQSMDNVVTTAGMQDVALSLSDGTLYVNTSVVSATDVLGNNGVIHVVDQVILPPAMRGEPTLNIVETAQANADFSTLVDLVIAADLVDTLSNEEANFTVFAPTNAAFDKIPDAALAAVGSDIDDLTGVLTQHVIATEINSVAAFAANGADVDTVAMEDVSVRLVNHTLAAANDDMNTEVTYDPASGLLVGGMGSSQPGFTLYVFDNDLGTDGSVCNGGCATAWPPVLVTDGNVGNIPGLSVIMRDDMTMQAAYLGRPLYFFQNDMAAGDVTGDGVNGVWFDVNLPEVSLQINGSNVTTTDIYTTNGVIHVIDTVILETLD